MNAREVCWLGNSSRISLSWGRGDIYIVVDIHGEGSRMRRVSKDSIILIKYNNI